MRVGVAIRTLGEVAVEGVNDGVLLALIGALTCPLSNTGTAGIGEYFAADGFKLAEQAVAFRRVAHLLRTRGYGIFRVDGQLLRSCLLGHRSGTGQIFIGRVGAGSDQTHFHVQGPAVGFGHFAQLGDGGGQIWRKWTVHVRLQFGQIDFNHLIEVLLRMRIDVRIGGQFTRNRIGQISHVTAVRGAQVALHGGIVGKRGGGGANFSTHITDGAFTGTRKRGSPFAEVLDNSSRSTLHRQDACHLEDHVLGRSPAVEFAGQLHTDELGEL